MGNIRAKIKDKIINIDFAGQSRYEYSDYKNIKLKYLGYGYYVSVNRVRQYGKKLYAHFFLKIN